MGLSLNKSIAASVLTASLIMSGCGSSSTSSFLSDLKVSSSEQNGDLWVNLSAQIETGGMLLAGLSVPIVNPKNPSETYGEISLDSNLCTTTICTNGGGTLTISANVSAISNLQASAASDLPNGTPLPVSSTAASSILQIPIGSGGAELYLGFGSNMAVIGVAIPFSALNGVGQYLPGVDVFDAFTISGVTGVAGIFAGSAANTTGFSMFVDLSSLLNPAPSASPAPAVVAASEAHSLAAVNSADLQTASSAKPVQFNIPKVSSSKRNSLMYKLYEASSNGVTLKYEQ